MSIDSLTFRRVLGQFATGVTVVTTEVEGKPIGFTANSFCSVSLDPPLILISIGTQNATYQAIKTSQKFAVNILAADQLAVARCFATNSPEKYEQFCSSAYHSEVTGSPVLDDALAWIDCRLFAEYPGGDHMLLLGEVQALGSRPGIPMVFANGKYGEMSIVQ